MNNPLTGVVGWTQYLLSQQLPSPVRTHLSTINDQAQRAARIVQNLLTFSRQHKPEKSSVSLNEVVENTLALRAYELRVNNIHVHRRLDPQLAAIHADPHQLQQVILNLIINAEQAMLQDASSAPVRGGELTIETSAQGEGVLLTVSDDGPGIPKELAKKIFDPFFTTKPIGQGTGLGLSISYGIIEEHGGRIWADSAVPGQPSRGARFSIFLPAAAELANSKVLEYPAKRQSQTVSSVLIVDDEESVRELLTAVLENDCREIHCASTGEEGLEKATTERYDLILTDLKMPGLGGSAFYDRLSTRLGGRTPRFVFMTGDVLGIETQRLLDRTGSSCILKPFDIHQAREMIQRTLESIVTSKVSSKAQAQ